MKTPIFLLVAAACLPWRAEAQTHFSIDWATVDGGGGVSSGGTFTLCGTIGQADAGTMTGGPFTLEGGFWGIIAAIQTDGAPCLSIELADGQVRVSWPTPAAGWVLTETNRLTTTGSPLWPQVPSALYQTNAGRIFILTQPQPMQNRFYQLLKP